VFIINKYLSSTLIRKLSWSGRTKESKGIVLIAFGEIKTIVICEGMIDIEKDVHRKVVIMEIILIDIYEERIM
jgi:hypothetical protein